MTFLWMSRGDNFVNWELWRAITWRYDNCNLCQKIISNFSSTSISSSFPAGLLSMHSFITQPVLILGIAPTQVQDLALEGSQEHIPPACHCPSEPSLPSVIPTALLSLVLPANLLEVCSVPLIEVLNSIGPTMGPWQTPQISSQNFICVLKKKLLYHRANELTHLKSY